MPYPICSVVAVFKMLIRILNSLRSRIWDRALFLFFCVLAPHGMNEIAFGERRGGWEQKTTVFIGSDIKALQIVNSNFIPNKKQLPKKEEPPIFVALERGLNASLEANIQTTAIESQI